MFLKHGILAQIAYPMHLYYTWHQNNKRRQLIWGSQWDSGFYGWPFGFFTTVTEISTTSSSPSRVRTLGLLWPYMAISTLTIRAKTALILKPAKLVHKIGENLPTDMALFWCLKLFCFYRVSKKKTFKKKNVLYESGLDDPRFINTQINVHPSYGHVKDEVDVFDYLTLIGL